MTRLKDRDHEQGAAPDDIGRADAPAPDQKDVPAPQPDGYGDSADGACAPEKGAQTEKQGESKGDSDRKDREIAELKDLLKRRQADFENYKKRMLKTQEEFGKLAIKDFALDIINVNDDLLRAIEASRSVKNGESIEQCHDSFVEGVGMISKMIEDVLKKYHIEEIDSISQAFDPVFNEAVEIVTSNEVSVDTVTKVYQKGFRLDDLVLRSAKVRVSRPPSGAGEGDIPGSPSSGNTGGPEMKGGDEQN